VAFSPEEDGCGWLMFDDNGTNASFHYVVLQITDMVLRPKTEGEDAYNPSIYYKCNFKGDEVVAENVETFGVALSVVAEPTAKILETKCGFSKFTDFESGESGNVEQNTGTLLKGIMKESNAKLVNKRNAGLDIYGRAYIQLTSGEYVFGDCRTRTLKAQVEEAAKRWTFLNTGNAEDQEKQTALLEMIEKFPVVMESWDIPVLDEDYNNVVYDSQTWYNEFVNLPVASADMTVDQLRQMTVDFFRLQQSFKWTPNTTFVYHDTETQSSGFPFYKESFCDYTTLEPNTVYKGLPYCMTGAYHVIDGVDQVTEPDTSIGQSGSIYKAMNYYNPATGVLDLATIYEKGGAQGVYDVLTSNCTNGLTWGWNRVSNSTTIYSTQHYTPANGAIPVGYYVWNEAEMSYVDESTGEIKMVDDAVSKIIAAQGSVYKGRFYKAYAQLQPGDGLVTDGHLRMCTGVRVVRDENDNIVSGESYVWYIDMNAYGSTDRYVAEGGGCEDYIYTQDNGNVVRDLGGIREHLNREGLDDYPGTPVSFYDLVEASYIPVTIPEFSTVERIESIRDQSMADFEAAGQLELWQTSYAPMYQKLIDKVGVEAPDVSGTTGGLLTRTTVTPTYFTQTYGGSIVSNYVISNIRITIEDSNGNTLAEETPLISTRNRTMNLKLKDRVVPVSDLLSEETLTQYAGQDNRIRISVCMSTGQWVEVLNAKVNAG